MTTAQEASGRLARPIPVTTFPFVTTIEVEDASARPDEPSPCLPTAAALFFELRPERHGPLVVDLVRQHARRPARASLSPDREPSRHARVPRLREPDLERAAVPAVDVEAGDTLLVQVGTSESLDGRLVARFELLHDRGARMVRR